MSIKAYCKQWFFLVLLLLPLHAVAANNLKSVRIWAAPDSTRVVFDLSSKPNYKYFTLTKPDRLVIDLSSSNNKLNFSKIKNSSKLIKRIRTSTPPKKGSLRVVIDLNKSIKAKVFSLKPTAPYGNRLVVDLEPTVKTAKKIVHQPKKALRDIVIAIDAGHGGEDPGSIGPSGMHEKKVVLQIAKRLKALIDKTPGMRAIMTRTGDYFVNLNRRSEIARKQEADLLVSIHADAFTTPQPRGASVWVLRKGRAETEMGRWLEQKERHSELLGGAGEIIQNTDSEQYLARALIEMVSDKSLTISHTVASDVLKQMGRVTKLHKKHTESAGFAVLKSPDIPSILVETGFISNPREERLLRSNKHQYRLANAIYKGIYQYFKINAPSDTLMASTATIKYKVVRGDSLSKIAQRYQVSVNSIKKANKLRSNTVRIGQNLIIPRS
ncbi:N-acetylmuramoyl-L-alanine amidase [Parashewanella tropica]|uniref:N-acetylmuramoyl-L-alanine amidase n=1 Tax=Parashewanella tropica TaxID=2547970 RepID=UPI00105A784E|nr:N-acetylmuramoyl-L-alanine amidase [Parashewanella tropica]